MKTQRNKAAGLLRTIWFRHSLSLIAFAILAMWFVLYVNSKQDSHPGSIFGNAIADWTGVVITVLVTKWLFEKQSKESRQPRRTHSSRILEFLHEHSLSIFLVITGLAWLGVFLRMNTESRWGTVVSNMVSEWTQQLGLVLLTKRLIETGSKESGSD